MGMGNWPTNRSYLSGHSSNSKTWILAHMWAPQKTVSGSLLLKNYNIHIYALLYYYAYLSIYSFFQVMQVHSYLRLNILTTRLK